MSTPIFFRLTRVLFFIAGFSLVSVGFVSANTSLSEDALADLVQPSVVRIAEHVTGTARVPVIKVDLKRKLVAAVPDRFSDVTVDEYLTGSGFIIHADGYIATNAHVVSLVTIKNSLASESALSAIYENALSLSEEEMQQFLDDQDGKRFSREIIQYIIDHSVFDLKHDIAVLRPGTKDASMHDLIQSGFPAQVVASHEQFFEDERDVALLKIEETHLPALSLGTSSDLTLGKKVFIFGFPSTAEINQNNPSVATFTRGVVSAVRETEDGQLKIFQTDAKVSQGSSGGPLFNEQGEVLGMISFQTDELSRSAGDNFAFALPIEIVQEQALAGRILPEEGLYGQTFRAGFQAFTERHCDTALTRFAEAGVTHQAFLTENILAPYVFKCRTWQNQGEARDTFWEEFKDGVSTLESPLLYVIGGSLLSFSILGVMMFWLLRQLRREEQEIEFLESRLRADEQELRRHEKAALLRGSETENQSL